MAKESAVAKHLHDKAEKEKNHKSKHDVERLHHIMAALTAMRDYPQSAPIASDLGKEIRALSLKQAEADAKETEEENKALSEARAADANSSTKEETHSSPPRAPTIADTRR